MHVERHFSHEVRKAYSSTSFVNEHSQHPDEDIVEIQVWLQDQFHKDITIKSLAEQFELSVRTLNRRFKSATGITPVNYLQQLRVDAAKDLLKNTNLSIYFLFFFPCETQKTFQATVDLENPAVCKNNNNLFFAPKNNSKEELPLSPKCKKV